MKNKYIIKAFTGLIIIAVALVMATPSIPAAFKNVQLGQPPPSFTLSDIDGKEWKSAELLPGKVTVLVIWATWSPRSSEILADLEKLREELKDKRFQILAINAERPQIGAAEKSVIKKTIGEIGSKALVLVDDGLVVFNEYGAMALPSSVVVDESGSASFAMAGYPTTMRGDLPQAVRLALGIVTEEEIAAKEEYVPKNRALMYFNLGKRLYEKGQEEKAEGQLLESIERDPDFVRPHTLLGILYKKTGRDEEALREFETVKRLDPRNHEAGYQAAAIMLQTKDYTGAEKNFRELSTEYPEKEEFALGLALAMKYLGDEKTYLEVKKKAGDLYPAEARYYFELASVAEKAEDLEEAASLYRQAIEKAFLEWRRHRQR